MEKVESTKRYQTLGIIAASLCFLVGFWHTGKGLSQFRVLDLQYGSFLVAAFILICLIMAYAKAVGGSKTALWVYLFFALVTFVCNVNSFYPSYRGDSLIREELRDHRQALVVLRESVLKRYKDETKEALIENVRAIKGDVVKQIKMEGYGPLAKKAVAQAEVTLGLQAGAISPPYGGVNQQQWDKYAEEMGKSIDDRLAAKLTTDNYYDKWALIRDVRQNAVKYDTEIGTALAEITPYKSPPLPLVDNIVKDFRDTCERAIKFSDKKSLFECNSGYASANKDIGRFSHTLSSTWNTLSDGGTIWVLVICLFLDFICPLAIYLLVTGRSAEWSNGTYLKPSKL